MISRLFLLSYTILCNLVNGCPQKHRNRIQIFSQSFHFCGKNFFRVNMNSKGTLKTSDKSVQVTNIQQIMI